MKPSTGCRPSPVGAESNRGCWLIVAPHWGQPGHLGAVRTARFCRWLENMGEAVSVVRAGSYDRIEDRIRGVCITVRDPLGFYRDPKPGTAVPSSPRRPNRVRTALAHSLFVPDPVVLWARRVIRNRLVRGALRDVEWVLSSSPPESCHLAAAAVARRSGAAHLVDLRDGWLDEPMIPLLKGSAVQQWRHRRIEAAIVGGARAIVVTSERWRELLIARYPAAGAKIAALPNAYPIDGQPRAAESDKRQGVGLTLLYAGKIYSSRPERNVDHLMRPLIKGLERHGGRGVIEFVGNLRHDEIRDLQAYETRLGDLGWRLMIMPPAPHAELWERLAGADGLLLLASSTASIPAKLFDYLPSHRPILAVTPEASEVDRLAGSIPQLFVSRLGSSEDCDPVVDFLNAATTGDCDVVVPNAFTETVLQQQFEQLLEDAGQPR